MLHFIRERAQGWVAWFIVGLISIPFALWGVNSYLTGPSDIVVARVNGEPIKQERFQQALQQYRDRMRDMMGDQFDPAMFEGDAVKRIVLDDLIEQKLLQATNIDIGQRISDGEINSVIQATPAFQSNNGFDPERYRLMLARIGFDPARYEAQLRLDLMAQQLTQNIQKTVLVSKFTVDNLLRLEKQTRDIAYGVISADDQLGQIAVTNEEVNTYYEQNKSKYMAPERVSVDYIELSVEDLAKKVDVDDTVLQQFYADNQDQFVGPEQRRASHILIEGDETEVLQTIQSLKQRIDNGEDFAKLAQDYSQDTGSAMEGGDLGLFQRDVMDPAFEQAVFSMSSVGEVSGPVKTEFGYHLIKLTDIKAPEGRSFSEARNEIEQLYRHQKAEELFYELAEKLADLSYENPDHLDIAAEELSLEIKTTDAFTREGGSGIASDKNLVNTAFSDDVLINDLNSSVIELDKSHLVVIHKNKHILASQLSFDSIAPAITEQLKYQRARDLARQQGEAILAKIKSGALPEELFEKNQWHPAQTYSRAESDVSTQLLNHAFNLPRPEPSIPQFSGFTADNGNYIIVSLSVVHDGIAADVAQEDRDGLIAYLENTYGRSEIQALINSIKDAADIEIVDKNLK